MTHRPLSLLPLALTLSLFACGSVDAGPGEDGPDGDSPDGGADHRADAGGDDDSDRPDAGDPGEGPAVVSVTPADGASGVRPGANIKIVFDRAMDTDSVEAAWSSELLPAGAVSFSWNPAGDTLTVDPDAPLPVAEGDGADPDAVEAEVISFAIGTGAAAADGGQLESALAVDFTTIRRLTFEVAYYNLLTDSMAGTTQPSTGPDTEYAGDTNGNQQVKIVVSFQLPDVVAGAELEQAVLSASQTSATTNIFSVLGDLEAVHVRFAQLTSAFAAASLGSVGIFSAAGGAGNRSLEVTGAVADDLDDGVAYAQFRLEFPMASDSDGLYDTAQFSRSSFLLRLDYLAE